MKKKVSYIIIAVIFAVLLFFYLLPSEKRRTFSDININYFDRFKTVTLGAYEQDGNLDDGKEPIDWYILDENDDSYLLISKDVIVSIWYNNEDNDTTWDKSILRLYLNQVFINEAFDDKMRLYINNSLINNNYVSKFGNSAGPSTYDKIFILSTEEFEKYFKNDRERLSSGTKYGESLGLERVSTLPISDLPFENASYYWTRTPGYTSNDVACICVDGHIDYYGFNGKTNGMGARPCIWIKKEALWKN